MSATPVSTVRPRFVRRWTWVGCTMVLPVVLTLASALGGPTWLRYAGVALLLTSLLALGALLRRTARLQLAALRAQLDGDLDAASTLYARAASQPGLAEIVGHSLFLCARVDSMRGAHAAAASMAHLASQLLADGETLLASRLDRAAAAVAAISFTADERPDEALRVLPTGASDADWVGTAALVATAKAFIAVVCGRPAEAIEHIDAERRLIETSLAGPERALAFVLECLAIEALGGVYRGASRSATPVLVSAREHAIVLRLLPRAAPFLVVEHWSP